MFEFYLRLGKSKPGSQAFATYLKTYYQGKISTLNHEWGTSHASFEKIPGTRPPKRYSMHMQQGIILGIRYKGVPDVALFTALSPYFDVNSINDSNRYGHLKPVYTTLYKATGKPLMLTEFSFFGFPSPGHTSALFIDVYTQANRGIGYHKYTLQAARARFMVGMHWFMWMDYAKQKAVTKGYPYPPDANVGLVAAGEAAVYEELGGWIKRTNAEVEATHRAIRWVPPHEPEPQRRPLQRFVPTVDGDVLEWPKALAIKPTMVTSLVDEVRADHIYFLSWDGQYIYLAGDIAATLLEHPPTEQARAWERDYLSLSNSVL